MKKLLIGYVAVTLLGIIFMILQQNNVFGVGFFGSSSHLFAAFSLPEYFVYASMVFGRIDYDAIPLFLFVMTVKLTGGYGIASFLSYLWNIKLEDVS